MINKKGELPMKYLAKSLGNAVIILTAGISPV